MEDCDQEVRQGPQTEARERVILYKGNSSVLIARLVNNLTVHRYMEIVIVGLTTIHLFPLKVLCHLRDVFLATSTSGLLTRAQISVKLLV